MKNIAGQEFYYGFYIDTVRTQGDRSMFSRAASYVAKHPNGTTISHTSKRELKKAIRIHLEAKTRTTNDILDCWKKL